MRLAPRVADTATMCETFCTPLAISQRVCMSTVDVRSDLSNSQRASGSVTTQNVNIVTDEADGTSSGAIAVSALALEFGAN